jgi:hypothetical protein
MVVPPLPAAPVVVTSPVVVPALVLLSRGTLGLAQASASNATSADTILTGFTGMCPDFTYH